MTFDDRTVLRIGAWRVDPTTDEISRGTETHKLEPRTMRLLLYLAAHPGQVVDVHRLLDEVWSGVIVTPGSVYQAIAQLRRLLGDQAEHPTYIDTHSRKGYRLVANVSPWMEPVRDDQPSTGADSSAPPGVRSRRRMWHISLAVVLGLIVVAAAADIFLRRERSTTPIRSIAVLPLTNLSADPDQEYFSDGLTDVLITDLAQLPFLQVVSHTTINRYKQTRKSLPAIARELKVDAIVEGTVARAGNHVRITAQLVRANDWHLWASTYEGELGDVLLLQRQIATQVAERVESRLRPGHTPSFHPVAAVNPVAYDEYLRGRYFWNKFMDFPQAIDHFARSVAADPGYAPAYVGLADCYQMLGTYLIKPAREVMPKAKEAALRAVALDETSGEAHVTLGHIMLAYDWDWSGSKREFERGLTLSPNYALGHHWYANWLLVLGYPEEAIREQRRAVELDPLSLIINTNLCRAYLFARRYDEAIAQCRKTLELEPRFGPASVWLTSAYAAKGMYRAFIEEQQRMLRLQGTPEATREADEVGRMFAEQGFVKYDRWSSKRSLDSCQRAQCPAGMLAEMYRSLGDRDKTMDMLEKAYEDREFYLLLLRVDEVFGSFLNSEPRYQALWRRMNLPPSTAGTPAQKR